MFPWSGSHTRLYPWQLCTCHRHRESEFSTGFLFIPQIPRFLGCITPPIGINMETVDGNRFNSQIDVASLEQSCEAVTGNKFEIDLSKDNLPHWRPSASAKEKPSTKHTQYLTWLVGLLNVTGAGDFEAPSVSCKHLIPSTYACILPPRPRTNTTQSLHSIKDSVRGRLIATIIGALSLTMFIPLW